MSPLISIDEARASVLAASRPLDPELLPVREGLDRFLAADVRAARDIPPFAASAMDGYALQPAAAGESLPIRGEARAGSPSETPLTSGTAMRISTGAMLPAGATAVVPQEDVVVVDAQLTLQVDVKPGDNVRPAGEVMRAGSVVLGAGTRVGPAELAAVISAGADAIHAARRPRVSVISTGDELREPGEPLGPGQIHNSNTPMLSALAAQAGALVLPAARIADNHSATQQGLAAALDEADVLVISGGVSVGPHDHVKPALADLNVREVFWGVALQPGKPTWFGDREGQLVFGLPGNPVSAAVTHTLFVAPALAALQGASEPVPSRLPGILGTDVRRNRAREQALRVRLDHRPDGVVAFPNGAQGSHNITSLVGAEALALIPAGEGALSAGSPVWLEPMPGM